MFNHNRSDISLYDIIPSRICNYMPGLVGDFLYGDGYSKHFINLEMYDIIYENNAAKSKKSLLKYYLSLINKKHAKQTFMMCMTLVKYDGTLLNKIIFKNSVISEALTVHILMHYSLDLQLLHK